MSLIHIKWLIAHTNTSCLSTIFFFFSFHWTTICRICCFRWNHDHGNQRLKQQCWKLFTCINIAVTFNIFILFNLICWSSLFVGVFRVVGDFYAIFVLIAFQWVMARRNRHTLEQFFVIFRFTSLNSRYCNYTNLLYNFGLSWKQFHIEDKYMKKKCNICRA